MNNERLNQWLTLGALLGVVAGLIFQAIIHSATLAVRNLFCCSKSGFNVLIRICSNLRNIILKDVPVGKMAFGSKVPTWAVESLWVIQRTDKNNLSRCEITYDVAVPNGSAAVTAKLPF